MLKPNGEYSVQGSVVVIDDDEATAEALGLLLDIERFHAHVFTTLAEAVAWGKASLTTADFLVVDYDLGHGETGFDAINSLRSLLREPTPALVVTGNRYAIDGERPDDCAILNKPTDPDRLLQAIFERLSEN